MTKLSAVEKETIILFNESEDTVEIYTYNSRIKRKIEKVRLAAPHLYRLIREDGLGGVTYQLPKSLFSVRFKLPVSKERHQELSDRARRTKPHLSHAKPQAFEDEKTEAECLPTQAV